MIYICEKCHSKAKILRFDLDSTLPKGETKHPQVCDKCYFKKDEPKKK